MAVPADKVFVWLSGTGSSAQRCGIITQGNARVTRDHPWRDTDEPQKVAFEIAVGRLARLGFPKNMSTGA